MASNTGVQKAEERQKLVGVSATSPEEKREKYKEWTDEALDSMEAKQPRKRSIIKKRRTALSRGLHSIFN